MSTEGQQFLQAALALPESERAEIAATLIRSLDSEPGDDIDAAWAAEIEKRIRSIDDGSAKLIPWDDVMQEVDGRLNG
jgi:putative addiction module component (TIGR02574 family)